MYTSTYNETIACFVKNLADYLPLSSGFFFFFVKLFVQQTHWRWYHQNAVHFDRQQVWWLWWINISANNQYSNEKLFPLQTDLFCSYLKQNSHIIFKKTKRKPIFKISDVVNLSLYNQQFPQFVFLLARFEHM